MITVTSLAAAPLSLRATWPRPVSTYPCPNDTTFGVHVGSSYSKNVSDPSRTVMNTAPGCGRHLERGVRAATDQSWRDAHGRLGTRQRHTAAYDERRHERLHDVSHVILLDASD
jgi:hypothetical protein